MPTYNAQGVRAYSSSSSDQYVFLSLQINVDEFADYIEYTTYFRINSNKGVSFQNGVVVFFNNSNKGEEPVYIPSNGGSSDLWIQSKTTVNRNTGTENIKTVYLSGRVQGLENTYPNLPEVTFALDIAGKAYGTPNAPTNVVVTQESYNNTKTITWINNPTAGAPYTNIFIDTTPSLSGYPVMLPGDATSYTDTKLPGGRFVYYTVQAANGSYKSAKAQSSTQAASAPPAPQGRDVYRTGPNTAVIEWVPTADEYTEDHIYVLYKGDTGYSFAGTAPSVGKGKLGKFIHTGSPDGQTQRYDVSSVAKIGSYTWPSSPTWVGDAYPSSPPAIPDPISPNGVFNVNNPEPFRWKHKPSDGSPQRKFQIQYRAKGNSTWINTSPVEITSSVEEYTFSPVPFSAGQDYEGQIRTWGAHSNPSPWASFTFSARVAPTISNLTVTPYGSGNKNLVTGADATASWTFYDPDGSSTSSNYTVSLTDNSSGNVVAQESGTTANSQNIKYKLENGKSYTVTVKATSRLGLTGTASLTFTVSYSGPASPTVRLSSDSGQGAIVISITNPTSNPATARNTVHRIQGGNETLIASNVSPNSSTRDSNPPLGVPITYRVTAISTLGTTSYGSASTSVSNNNYLSYFSAGSLVMSFCADPDVRVSYSREQTLHQFAGRSKPVKFLGTHKKKTITVSGMFSEDAPNSNPKILESIIDSGETVQYRDCFGNVIQCTIDSLDYSQSRIKYGDFTVKLTEIEYQ